MIIQRRAESWWREFACGRPSLAFSFKKDFFLRMCVLAGAFLCLDVAQADAEQPRMDLGTIIVSPKRVESQEEDVAGNVAVYGREAIEKISAHNLGETLQYMPGVDVSVTNEFGQSTAVTIHGSASRQVRVMIDGIPFNTQVSGQADPTIIPIDHMKRVEVIKGAASSAWGSSLGGVINVITQDVGDSAVPKGRFKSHFAEFSTTKNSLELAGTLAKAGYFISGSYLETDGIKSRSDVEENKFFGKMAYPFGDDVRLTSSFGYTGAKVHDGVNADDTWMSAPYIARYGKVQLDVKNDHHYEIAYKYNDQDITTETYTASTGTLDSSTVNHNTYQGISLKSSMSFRDEDIWVLGSDFDWHEIKSSNYLDTSKSIQMQAPYTNYTWKGKNFDVIPGLRYDHNQRFGSQTSPALGAVYRFHDTRQTLARAKISRAFNAPPLMWIANDDPSVFVGPNPDLKAERAVVYELGLETELMAGVDLKLDLYRADVKDALALVFDGGVYKYDNFRKFRRQGAEMSLKYTVSDEWSFFGSGGFTDVVNRETGDVVRDADIARQSFTLGGTYKNDKGFGAHLSGYYKRWSADPGEANDRKFILDLKFTQEFQAVRDHLHCELFLSIHNLTNSKYWSNPTYPLPPRYFEGGFSLKF